MDLAAKAASWLSVIGQISKLPPSQGQLPQLLYLLSFPAALQQSVANFCILIVVVLGELQSAGFEWLGQSLLHLHKCPSPIAAK